MELFSRIRRRKIFILGVILILNFSLINCFSESDSTEDEIIETADILELDEDELRYTPPNPPTCPIITGRKEKLRLLFDNSTKSCFVEHSKGPCGERMIFYQDFGYENAEKYGFCDCDDIIKDFSQGGRLSPPPRPLIYIHELNGCYSAFSRGPCPSDRWLVLSDLNFTPECTKNPCQTQIAGYYDDEYSEIYWVEHKGKCYKTFTKAYCLGNKRLQPTEYSYEPKCEHYYQFNYNFNNQFHRMQDCGQQYNFPAPTQSEVLHCRRGRRRDYLGLCVGRYNLNRFPVPTPSTKRRSNL